MGNGRYSASRDQRATDKEKSPGVMRGGESSPIAIVEIPCKNAANACTKWALSSKVSISRDDDIVHGVTLPACKMFAQQAGREWTSETRQEQRRRRRRVFALWQFARLNTTSAIEWTRRDTQSDFSRA